MCLWRGGGMRSGPPLAGAPARPECAESGPPLIEALVWDVVWVRAERRRVAQGCLEQSCSPGILLPPSLKMQVSHAEEESGVRS